jgi:hypothetical protein
MRHSKLPEIPGPLRWFEGFKEKALTRGAAYTSLDAMKLLAIVSMTTDHVGYYFLPHELWCRALGRITIPVWFFLAGYSRTRTLSRAIWIYALILILNRLLFGYLLFPLNTLVSVIFPLNALISVILCRLFLNFCDDRNWIPNELPLLIIACTALTTITPPFFEYGSMTFLFALMGRAVRERHKEHLVMLAGTSYVTYIFWQLAWFKFNALQGTCAALGSLFVVCWLARFSNKVMWADWQNSRFKAFIAVLSRNTMPYYFYHRMAFEIIAAFALN